MATAITPPPGTLIQRALRSALVVVVSVVVSLALVEGLLRLFPGLLPEGAQLRLMWNTEEFDSGTVGDPYLGFRYPGNREIMHRTRDFAVRIKTDEHGFRNESPWPTGAEVVVVGDSMAFGYGVETDKSWWHLLERQLQFEHVINLSLPGLGPEQYFRYFETLGSPLHPRLLILCLFPANDVVDAKRFQHWEAAGAQGDYSMSQILHATDPHATAVKLEPPGMLERTRLFLTLKAVRSNLTSRFHSETLRFPQGRVQLFPAFFEGRMSEFGAANSGLQALVESVQKTRALSEQLGSRLLVVLFPSKEEVYLPARGETFPDMVTPVRDALHPLKLDILDLRDGLRQHANDSQPVFFEVDGHPNESGNAVIASLVQEHLERSGAMAGIGETQ